MAQDQSIEAARARIQRLVDEIASLSKKELRSEEFFQEYLTRAVQATDAKGGAVWLVGQRANDGKSEFQLAAQVDLESSGFHQDQQQHAVLLRALIEVVRTKQPFLSPPEPPAPDPSSLQAQLAQIQPSEAGSGSTNRTAYPFFHLPLFLKDQVLGVLQIWLQPYVTAQSYPEFVTFLSSLATHAEQHLQSRRLGNLVLENQRLQHVLKFTSDIAGSLDPQEIARLAANYGRDLVGCERCSVLAVRGDRWEVLAISGQEVVERKSAMVKAMRAFVGVHARAEAFLKPSDSTSGPAQPAHELLILSKKELIARHGVARNGEKVVGASTELTIPQQQTDEIDLAYFEHSHVVSAAIAPMFDAEHQLIGAYFAESTAEGFFDRAAGTNDASASQRLTEWLATHTGRTLQGAQSYQALPFLAVTRRIRDSRLALTGHKRRRNLTRLFVTLGILALLAFYPKQDQVDGNCNLVPRSRAAVVPEVAGRVERILAREGQQLTKGQAIAQLDVSRLETQLARVRSEKQRSSAEADRYRGAGDEAGAQVALLQSRVAEQEEKQLLADIAAATLRSPIDGVLLTKGLELQAGEFIQPGAPFAEIAALTDWELNIDVNEKQIGRVERTLAGKSPLPVNYILYSQSAFKLESQLENRDQISAVAYSREAEQVFIVTLRELGFPEALQKDLRPGLTGRAKINLGREPLVVWTTKRIIDWLRLRFIG